MELKLDTTYICAECGEEIESGLSNHVNHFRICKYNSPNENIQAHKEMIEYDKIRKKREKIFNKVWKKMKLHEQNELWLLSHNGWNDGKTTFMGKVAYDQYYDFRDKMIKKYNKLKR